MSSSISPEILKRIQGEDRYQQQQQRGARRVKLDKGHSWIIRFLPAQMGPDKLWFARIAKHWANKLSIVCPRNTGSDYGGDPDAPCDVCEAADELNEHPDKVISKVGYDGMANAQYLTYCIVLEKDDQQLPMSEVLNPYEFNHYRSTWDELKGFYLTGGRSGKNPNSVLDYEFGNDFCIMRKAVGNGMRLDKLDVGPIFDLDDPKFNEYIKTLEKAMKTPRITIPTAADMRIFAQKMHEFAERSAGRAGDEGGAPRGRAGRGGGRYAETDTDDAPVARSRRPAQTDSDQENEAPRARARTSERVAENDDDVRPRQRAAAPADPDAEAEAEAGLAPAARHPAQTAARRPEPADVDDAVPQRSRAAATTPAVAGRRPAAPVDEEEPLPEEAEVEPAIAGRRTLEPTARRAAAGPEPEDPEDTLPEEVKDSAPAARRTPAPAQDADAPTPVARRGGPAPAAETEAGSAAGAKVANRLRSLPRNS